MGEPINLKNAAELQKKSVAARKKNYVKKYRNVPELYATGGLDTIAAVHNVGIAQARRLVKRFVQ